ncbi:hypothetical protein B9Z55_015077 [Caenorhabditis nigoni]|uniref:Uncharacterized protein n=1 Tax=Caenorhabditis nigoni TaxID=1611254 RepID=A0A2G5U8L9_9PELO|nr:hypothetical protein B9Z55_015077 [Caenorhabditis nigoni]
MPSSTPAVKKARFLKPEPIVELLISKELLRGFNGKCKMLNRLMDHPNAQIPANKRRMVILRGFFDAWIDASDLLATDENVEFFKKCMIQIQEYEEFIIRAVVQGEDFRDVLDSIRERKANRSP